ncbi:META domain-containing protein [uncultured Algimonas sp.]|uniref:META domain-containing protein n=1 Tax=uncultured Algimonas sp. TaxID=1547920 RepID=UPI00261AFF4F|nr:META domain-containing protein [uncultured Algimonas sp.]
MIGRVVGSLVVMAALAACQKALSHATSRPLASLAGTEWGPMDREGDRFVAFKADGEVVGSGGCNDFFGNFHQSGRVVTFGPLASTKKACPAPLMQAERDFLDLLSRVRAAEATWKELTLFGEDGDVLAVMRRRDWD